MSAAKSFNPSPDFCMRFLNFSLFTGTKRFCTNRCSKEFTSVANLMVSLCGSAASTCYDVPFRYTVKATAFSASVHWLLAVASSASNCLWCSSEGLPLKIGILKLLGFSNITAACCLVPSDTWLMTEFFFPL